MKKHRTLALWKVSYPLMLNALSANLLLFSDRLFISNYSITALAAVATIGMIFTIFQFATTTIVSIGEVFVGKYNGAEQHFLIGPVVWQMIWFSLLTIFIYFPSALFLGKFFLPANYYNEGLPYYKTIMLFGPIFTLVAALSTFFIGRGEVKLVTITTLITNFVNIILAYIFVFGMGNIIAAHGPVGAAFATGISISIQALVLFVYFFQEVHHITYKTKSAHIKIPVMWECLKVGAPNAFSYLIEMAAWAMLLQIMIHADQMHITVLVIGQTLLLAMCFATEGLQKGLTVVTANQIGAKEFDNIKDTFLNGIKIHLGFALFFGVLLLLFGQSIVKLFDINSVNEVNEFVFQHYSCLLALVFIYYLVDGAVWVIGGMLIAFEDTFFILIMNVLAVWLFVIVPVFLLVHSYKTSAFISWQAMLLYASINLLGFALRLRRRLFTFRR